MTAPSSRPIAQAAILVVLLAAFTTAFQAGRRAVVPAETLVAATSTAGQAPPKPKRTPRERLQAKAAPSDQFMLIRSGPDGVFDERAYDAALDAVRAGLADAARRSTPGVFSGSWRLEGPANIGGRINTIAVDPTNSLNIYVGAAAGGLFRSTNGGSSWAPLFDDRPNLFVSCIAFQPGSPSTIYVGTGDPALDQFARSGDGIWKSSNGGATWTNIGLNNMGVIMKVIPHPTSPNTLYAAAMGKLTVRDQNRGVYKTTNGGVTWTRILTTGNETGVVDLLLNPSNTNILYAAAMTRIRTNQESIVTGAGAKVYRSLDGGTTWSVASNGLPPAGTLSRIGLAMPTSQPQTVYCSVVDSTLNLEGLYRTTNNGTSCTRLPATNLPPDAVNGFGWYFEQVFVNPTDPDEVFIGGVDLYRSDDGGQSFQMVGPPWFTYEVHADKHDLAFIGADTVLLATDGGLYRSDDSGTTWTDIEDLPITQFYRVAVNPHVPGEYWGGAQDNGTTRGSAASPTTWDRVWGGDGFQVRFEPNDPNLIYVETQNGNITAVDPMGNFIASVSQGITALDRCNWDMPYFLSAADPTTLYTGTYRVWRMDGAPQGSWNPISPDLTDGLGTLTPRFHTISALAESPVATGNLYAGTVDANVWRTTDGGATWQNVTGTLPERYVTCVRASPNTANTVYVTHSGYRNNEYLPHIHKSTNNGTTWTDISGDLPNVGINSVIGYPGTDQILIVATDAGVYATRNGGQHWERVGDNMPVYPVYDLELDMVNHRLVAGTYARSIQSFPLGTITGLPADAAAAPVTVALFPNPTTEQLTLGLPAGLRVSALRILNLRGQVVTQPPVTEARTVDVRDLRAGTYVLEIRTVGGAVVRRRFVRAS